MPNTRRRLAGMLLVDDGADRAPGLGRGRHSDRHPGPPHGRRWPPAVHAEHDGPHGHEGKPLPRAWIRRADPRRVQRTRASMTCRIAGLS